MINTLLLSAVLQQNVQLAPADLLSRVRTSYSKVSSAQFTLTSRVASHGFDKPLISNVHFGGAMNGSRLSISRKKEGAMNWFVLSEKANGVGTLTYYIDATSFLIMRTTSANEQGQVETDAMISGLKLQKR